MSKSLLAMLFVVTALLFAGMFFFADQRCKPGDRGILVGNMLVEGCG